MTSKIKYCLQQFKLQMFNSYQDFYYKYYSSKNWTSTHAFCLVIAYIVVALPFYFCFSGGNFWLDTRSNLMNVNYNYTGYYSIQVNYISGISGLSDQFSNIPGYGLSPPETRSIILAVDDQTNTSTATLSLTGYNSLEVLSTNIILYYDVEIPSMLKVISQAVTLSIAGNINSATIIGVLKIEGNQPISGISTIVNTNFPLYYPYQTAGFKFSTLSSFLYQNNGYLKSITQSSTINGAPVNGSRSIALNLNKIKSTSVNYYPTILETFKFKYSSYLAFAIISFYIFSTLFKLYMKEGMLESETQMEKIKIL